VKFVLLSHRSDCDKSRPKLKASVNNIKINIPEIGISLAATEFISLKKTPHRMYENAIPIKPRLNRSLWSSLKSKLLKFSQILRLFEMLKKHKNIRKIRLN